MRKLTVLIVTLGLLAGCEPEGGGEQKPAKKSPGYATVQVCGQVNRGEKVPNPLPMGLPSSIEQSVKQYQQGYGKSSQEGIVGRIRRQCRDEGVAL